MYNVILIIGICKKTASVLSIEMSSSIIQQPRGYSNVPIPLTNQHLLQWAGIQLLKSLLPILTLLRREGRVEVGGGCNTAVRNFKLEGTAVIGVLNVCDQLVHGIENAWLLGVISLRGERRTTKMRVGEWRRKKRNSAWGKRRRRKIHRRGRGWRTGSYCTIEGTPHLHNDGQSILHVLPVMDYNWQYWRQQ